MFLELFVQVPGIVRGEGDALDYRASRPIGGKGVVKVGDTIPGIEESAASDVSTVDIQKALRICSRSKLVGMYLRKSYLTTSIRTDGYYDAGKIQGGFDGHRGVWKMEVGA